MSVAFSSDLFRLRSELTTFQANIDASIHLDALTKIVAVFHSLKDRVYQEPIDLQSRASLYTELAQLEILIHQASSKVLDSNQDIQSQDLPRVLLKKMATHFYHGNREYALAVYSLLSDPIKNRLHGLLWKVANRPEIEFFGRRVIEAPSSLGAIQELDLDEYAFAAELMVRPLTNLLRLSILVEEDSSSFSHELNTLSKETAHWLYRLTWKAMGSPDGDRIGELCFLGLEGHSITKETKREVLYMATALVSLMEQALDRAHAKICHFHVSQSEKEQIFLAFLHEVRSITKEDELPILEGESLAVTYTQALPYLTKYGIEKYVQLFDKTLRGLDSASSIACDPFLQKEDQSFFAFIMKMDFQSLSAVYQNYLDRPALAQYFMKRLSNPSSCAFLFKTTDSKNKRLTVLFPLTKAMHVLSIETLFHIGEQLKSCMSCSDDLSTLCARDLLGSSLYVLALAKAGSAHKAVESMEELFQGRTPKEAIYYSIYKLAQELDIGSEIAITDEIFSNEELLLDFIDRDESFFLAADARLRENPHFAIQALKKNKQVFSFLPKTLKANLSFLFQALEADSNVLAYTSPEIRKNKDFIFACVKQNPSSLIHADPSVFEDIAFVINLVKVSAEVASYLPRGLQQNEEIAAAAIENDGRAYLFFAKKIQDDKGFALMAIKQHPELISTMPANWLADEAFLLASVKMNGLVLKYLQLSVKEGSWDRLPFKDLFVSAVRENKEAIKYIRFSQILGSESFKERMISMLEKIKEDLSH